MNKMLLQKQKRKPGESTNLSTKYVAKIRGQDNEIKTKAQQREAREINGWFKKHPSLKRFFFVQNRLTTKWHKNLLIF